MEHNESKVEISTIVRTICLALALVNQLLSVNGKSPLPIKNEQVEALVSTAFTVVTSVWGWWKNNSFSQAALAGDTVMKALKRGDEVKVEGVK